MTFFLFLIAVSDVAQPKRVREGRRGGGLYVSSRLVDVAYVRVGVVGYCVYVRTVCTLRTTHDLLRSFLNNINGIIDIIPRLMLVPYVCAKIEEGASYLTYSM